MTTRHLYDEVEAETALAVEQLVFKLADLVYAHCKRTVRPSLPAARGDSLR